MFADWTLLALTLVRAAWACDEDCPQDEKDPVTKCCPVVPVITRPEVVVPRVTKSFLDAVPSCGGLKWAADVRSDAAHLQCLVDLNDAGQQPGSLVGGSRVAAWGSSQLARICAVDPPERDLWTDPLTVEERLCAGLRIKGAFGVGPAKDTWRAALARSDESLRCALGDTTHLEPSAMLGRLLAEEKLCLEAQVAQARQSQADRASRVLLANAIGAGDESELLRLLNRHLHDISRADPALELVYAIHLHRRRAYEEARVWALRAAERSAGGKWTRGGVRSALRLALECSIAQVEAAVASGAHAEDSTSFHALEEQAYGDYVQWADWLRASEAPMDGAYEICRSLGESEERCSR